MASSWRLLQDPENLKKCGDHDAQFFLGTPSSVNSPFSRRSQEGHFLARSQIVCGQGTGRDSAWRWFQPLEQAKPQPYWGGQERFFLPILPILSTRQEKSASGSPRGDPRPSGPQHPLVFFRCESDEIRRSATPERDGVFPAIRGSASSSPRDRTRIDALS